MQDVSALGEIHELTRVFYPEMPRHFVSVSDVWVYYWTWTMITPVVSTRYDTVYRRLFRSMSNEAIRHKATIVRGTVSCLPMNRDARMSRKTIFHSLPGATVRLNITTFFRSPHGVTVRRNSEEHHIRSREKIHGMKRILAWIVDGLTVVVSSVILI